MVTRDRLLLTMIRVSLSPAVDGAAAGAMSGARKTVVERVGRAIGGRTDGVCVARGGRARLAAEGQWTSLRDVRAAAERGRRSPSRSP